MGAWVDPATRDFLVDSSGRLVVKSQSAAEHLYRRVTTQRGSCLWDLNFGSTLFKLVKTSADLERSAVDRVEQAIAPMVEAGELVDVEVSAEREGRSRLNITIQATDAGMREVGFTTFLELQ